MVHLGTQVSRGEDSDANLQFWRRLFSPGHDGLLAQEKFEKQDKNVRTSGVFER